MSAADKESKVDDFEVGVFNGEYVTGVPDGYFEHLRSLRQGKKRKACAAGMTVVDTKEHEGNGVVVTNSGPVNGAGEEYREDIRFVEATANFPLRLILLTCRVHLVFTTLQANSPAMNNGTLLERVGGYMKDEMKENTWQRGQPFFFFLTTIQFFFRVGHFALLSPMEI
jgi:hypothetical protein